MNVLVLCKFTPLGFETTHPDSILVEATMCKFTPLGFETLKR